VAARLCRARLVYDAHELFTEIGRLPALVRRPLALVERALIRRVDAAITVNASIAGELARRYGVAPPVVVMNCPRTAGEFAPRGTGELRRAAAVPDGQPLVLFQGMFMANRGLENLVRAWRDVPRGHLAFLGWGPLRPALAALAREAGVAGRVHLLEGVAPRDLLAWTADADVGVIPYRNVGLNNYLTSPNKLFEYLAAGVPVAASAFPELRRVIEGDACGRTFDPEDPLDIARALRALLDDPLALEAARAGAREAGRRYTWENESRALLDVYARVAPSAAVPG
jgi:glycosyltransferase involved in cell wall biosynthesis